MKHQSWQTVSDFEHFETLFHDRAFPIIVHGFGRIDTPYFGAGEYNVRKDCTVVYSPAIQARWTQSELFVYLKEFFTAQ
jgi:hypothetical protein